MQDLRDKGDKVACVAIRVDASDHIGGGHAMRCLTLADALGARGAQVNFIMRTCPPAISDMIKDRGHGVIQLEDMPFPPAGDHGTGLSDVSEPPHAGWLNVPWSVDAEQSVQVLEKSGGVDWLIVDHYALDARWEKRARDQAAKIMIIDDLADRRHDCDILLDQTLGRMSDDYKMLVSQKARVLLGTRFALLRGEFQEKRAEALSRRQYTGPVQRIFFSLGATDPDGLVPRVLAAIVESCPQVNIDLAIGAVDPKQKALAAIVKNSEGRIRSHGFSASMADLMVQADMAVGAGGTTSWERCCLGLPTLMLVLADNQVNLAGKLEACGAVQTLQLSESANMNHLARLIKTLATAPEILQEMSRAAKSVCDGRGAERVANVLLESKSSVADDLLHQGLLDG